MFAIFLDFSLWSKAHSGAPWPQKYRPNLAGRAAVASGLSLLQPASDHLPLGAGVAARLFSSTTKNAGAKPVAQISPPPAYRLLNALIFTQSIGLEFRVSPAKNLPAFSHATNSKTTPCSYAPPYAPCCRAHEAACLSCR